MNKNTYLVASLGLCASLISGCGAASLSEYPTLGTIVKASLPAGLKTAALSDIQQLLVTDLGADVGLLGTNGTTEMAAFKTIFTNTYSGISGTSATGYVQTMIGDLDYRFASMKTRTPSSACSAAKAQSYTVDLSGVDSVNADTLKLTLDVQCRDVFSTSATEPAGTDSGMVIGKSGNNYSMMLVLNEKNVTSSAFGYAAKVTDKGSNDEIADIMFAEARSSGASVGARDVVVRIRAQQKKGIFEMVLASTTPSSSNSSSGTQSNMGCGLYGITNGTYIYAAGEYLASSITCTGTPNFELCLNAADGTAATNGLSDCTTVKAAMTIGTAANLSLLDATVVTTAKNTTVYSALQIKGNTLDTLTSTF